jgi:hypothetical protein
LDVAGVPVIVSVVDVAVANALVATIKMLRAPPCAPSARCVISDGTAIVPTAVTSEVIMKRTSTSGDDELEREPVEGHTAVVLTPFGVVVEAASTGVVPLVFARLTNTHVLNRLVGHVKL